MSELKIITMSILDNLEREVNDYCWLLNLLDHKIEFFKISEIFKSDWVAFIFSSPRQYSKGVDRQLIALQREQTLKTSPEMKEKFIRLFEHFKPKDEVKA